MSPYTKEIRELQRNNWFVRRRIPLIGAFLAATFVVLTGCSSEPAPDRLAVFPVSGQVRLNGNPLANAFVVLHPRQPADARTLPARGKTDQEGRFQLTSYEANDGAAIGEYAVTVEYYQLVKNGESYIAGPNVLPPKIANPATSDIVVRVATGENRLTPIELRR